jgi:hypothetical protein
MDKSESIASLAKAMVKAQTVIKPAIKDSNNPFFKSKYADLGSVFDACKDALNNNGITVMQPTSMKDGIVSVETVLLHESGEWISSLYPVKPAKENDPQSLGSAITYARRYSLASIVGVVADEDDDGNAGSGRHVEAPKRKPEDETEKFIKSLEALGYDRNTLNPVIKGIVGQDKDMHKLSREDTTTVYYKLKELAEKQGANKATT